MCLETLKGGDVQSIELGLQGIKIFEKFDGSICSDLYNAVVGWLLRVLVNETTGKNWRHLRTIKRWDFGEDSGVWVVTTVFGEEDWDGSFGEIGCKNVVARSGEG